MGRGRDFWAGLIAIIDHVFESNLGLLKTFFGLLQAIKELTQKSVVAFLKVGPKVCPLAHKSVYQRYLLLRFKFWKLTKISNILPLKII